MSLLDGTVLCNSSALEVTKSRDRITGVVAETGDGKVSFEAGRGVVLAAGYFHPRRMERYFDERFASVDNITPPTNGDGHLIAQRAGGKLVNMDIAFGPNISFVPPERPFAMWQHPQVTLFENGAILVNAKGERFCNEKLAMEREIGL